MNSTLPTNTLIQIVNSLSQELWRSSTVADYGYKVVGKDIAMDLVDAVGALIARVQSAERWAMRWKRAAKYKRNVIMNSTVDKVELHKIMDTRIAELRMERDAAQEDCRMMQMRLNRVVAGSESYIVENDVLKSKLTAIVKWLEKNQPDVFARGIWEAINDSIAAQKADKE